MARDMSKLEAAEFEVQGNVAIVRMNRPENANSLNTDMHRDMDACWDEINENPDIRAAVVTGNGRFFCAGRDIKEYLNTYAADGQEVLRPIDDPDHELFGRLCNHYRVHKPLIGALQGPAVGGGLEIALMCDMIVMSEETYIADLHAKVNVGGMNTLLWFLPPNIARELSMTDRRLTAQECFQYGFANRVVAKDQVLDAALELARKTTEMGPDSIDRLKEGSLRLQLESGLTIDEASIERRRETVRASVKEVKERDDLLEGMKAFAHKRKATFSN